MEITWLGQACFRIKGLKTTVITDPLTPEGGSADAKQAMAVTGQCKLINNHLVGFDERSGASPAKP